jgi:ribonuclease HI
MQRSFEKIFEMKHVTIYTDGACSGNPGPGGWAAILLFGIHRKEISGGLLETTNNRMELIAVIESLSLLKERCAVSLYSDSKYIVDAINAGWLKKWQANNWMRNKKEKALNVDLWKRLLPFLRQHQIKFLWTKGHANDELNNRCDELAVAASKRKDLQKDERKIEEQ